MFLHLPIVGAIASTSVSNACSRLKSLSLENTTILDAFYQTSGTNVSAVLNCYPGLPPTFLTSADVCRVQGYVNTTSESSLFFEAWLPDTWYGRFLGLGNGGLGGCYDWRNIDYGSAMHFAAFDTNAGHTGIDGTPFFHHPEVMIDFSYRAVHTEAIIGKQLVEAYYDSKPEKSYYLGCSSGGREGFKSALMYPEDFDGIIAGSPAVDWNILYGDLAMLSTYTGAPNASVERGYIQPELWPVIAKEILRKCDRLDGLVDGIISEPDNCGFDPQTLLCAPNATAGCLTEIQVNALRKIYSPLIGSQGEYLFPRYDPGAEGGSLWQVLFSGEMNTFTAWFPYAVFNYPNFSFEGFNVKDVEFGQEVNPANIATWSGDLSAFRSRGAKLLTYHGRSDNVIPSGISKRQYDLISSTLKTPYLDDFYRLFLVPGMGHCYSGPGNWRFGQGSGVGTFTSFVNDTTHNILLALVDWVEGGAAPDTITGFNTNGTSSRVHCRYPYESWWNGTEWVCL